MEIPAYFQKYMDEKFESLHEKIDAVIHEHDKDILDIKSDLSETKDDVKWLNQKVWGAIGIAGVVVVVGGILAANFKALNNAQIKAAVDPVTYDVQKIKYDIANIQENNSVIKKTLESYQFVIEE